MNSVYVEGTLDRLRQVPAIAGVQHVDRGVIPLGGDRYRIGADVDDAAIPLIEALGCTIEVVMDQAALDAHAALLDAEESGPEIA